MNDDFRRTREPAQLAQSEERSAFNRVVVGSIPTLGASFDLDDDD